LTKSNSSGGAVPYVCELTRRRYRKPPPAIRGPEDVAGLPAVRRLRAAKREHFVVLVLNARHECTGVDTISIGSLNASIVHPREVFLPAVSASAAAVVLVHNHPSGDPEPSEEDLSITKRLVQCGETLGISVLDHIIIAGRGCTSLRSRDML
jgi:DNA repair protein RadC